GNTGQARRLWGQIVEKAPHDTQARLILFDLALRDNDQPALEQIADEVKALDNEAAMWRYTRATAILAKGRAGDKSGLSEARRLLLEVQNLRSGWGPAYRAFAPNEDMEGDSQRALERYQQALQLGDRNPHALRRTMQILWNQHRYTEADQILKKVD